MYSASTFHGQPYVRTQRSSQFRWLLMGVGALALGTAGGFTYQTFLNEYQQARSIAETAVLAGQVDSYKPVITKALSQADKAAAEIGDEVADPAAAKQFKALRDQARTLLNTGVEVPATEEGPQTAYLNREVANGLLAVNAAIPVNLQKGEKALRESHEAYQELVDAKANAAAAKAELTAAIPAADQLLFETAPTEDGWTFVEEALRAPLGEAIQNAHNVELAADNPDLTSVADFKKVADDCHAALAKIRETSEAVSSNIERPDPVVVLDENGNPVPVEAPAEPAPAEPAPAEPTNG